MTTEEKLQHFYEVSMESAREESEKALEEYRAALSQMLAEHKEDKQKNAANQLKLETENAKREINKALSAEQLHIKRRLSSRNCVRNCLWKSGTNWRLLWAALNTLAGWKKRSGRL